MTGNEESDGIDLPRRTFMKGVGAAAGAGLLGIGAGTVAGDSALDDEYLNWRVLEAQKVWERGYRGHPERTIGLTDTGIDARHPDVGPWNGVTVVAQGGDLKLTTPEALETQGTTELAEYSRADGSVRFEGPVGPGTFVEGTETVLGTFGPDGEESIPDDAAILTAKLFWEPFEDNSNDLELRIDRRTEDGGWTEHARVATAGMPEVAEDIGIVPEDTYRYVAEAYKNVQCQAWMEELFLTYEPLGDDVEEFDEEFGSIFDHETTDDDDKVVGWYSTGRWGDSPAPSDSNGHGTHCSSIMGGTGEASTVDPDRLTEDEPRAILTAGDYLEYEVTAAAGTGVFASAYGDAIEVAIEGPDGRELRRSSGPSPVAEASIVGFRIGIGGGSDSSLLDNNVVDHPTVHDEGEATYTVIVHPIEGEAVSTSRVERVAAGAFEAPADAADSDAARLHPGIAPDQPLVGLQGFSGPVNVLDDHGADWAEWFGLRSVNMSWSYVDPVTGYGTPPLGAAGGELNDLVSAVKGMAEDGILTVAAGSNSFTPAQTSAPALADEAISVIATGPRDGITEYSSGGMAAEDEDDEGQYVKPDVTAPGGQLDNSIRAAKTEGEDADPEAVRDYTRKAGTSMAAPYTNGVAGLVAQAMEFQPGCESWNGPPPHSEDEANRPDCHPGNGNGNGNGNDDQPTRRDLGRPDAVTLPEPAETGIDDVFRLKQVILATATETAFTAAPYHRGHVPTYDFGERDIYEGYGRVNPDAAVDAVTRDLLPADSSESEDEDPNPPVAAPAAASYSATTQETVGLDVPEDARAFAGFVDVRGGSLEVDVSFDYYSGGNKGMTKGDPHLDLFVYDASDPAHGGDPNVVASAQGLEGSPSVSVDLEGRDLETDEAEQHTLFVVGKLVNVPGVVNGYDVQANFTVDVSYQAVDAPLPSFSADGSRADDGHATTHEGTNHVEVTLGSFSDGVTEVRVTDFVPDGWTVQGYSEHVEDTYDAEDRDGTIVDLGTVSQDQLDENGSVMRQYFVEATGGTGQYEFGPAVATVVDREDVVFEGDENNDTIADTFTGTDSNAIVGASQNDPVGSSTENAGETAGETTGSATDGLTGTVEDTL